MQVHEAVPHVHANAKDGAVLRVLKVIVCYSVL